MRERNERQNDVGKSLPTADEFAMLHEIFTGSASGVSATSPGAEVVPMRDTHMSSTVIMFPQEKNVHNKIFGGFMMRQGFELAWGTAHVFAGSRPIFLASDDIVFRRPVPIGSIVVFDSHVACTEGETVQVSVQADVLDPTAGTRECTNTFQFTFRASAPLTRQVVPETYAEGMSYVRGRRIVGKLAHEPMGDSMFGDA